MRGLIPDARIYITPQGTRREMGKGTSQSDGNGWRWRWPAQSGSMSQSDSEGYDFCCRPRN